MKFLSELHSHQYSHRHFEFFARNPTNHGKLIQSMYKLDTQHLNISEPMMGILVNKIDSLFKKY